MGHYAEYLRDGEYVDLRRVLQEATTLDIVVFGKNVYGNLKNLYSIPSRRGVRAATTSIAHECGWERGGYEVEPGMRSVR